MVFNEKLLLLVTLTCAILHMLDKPINVYSIAIDYLYFSLFKKRFDRVEYYNEKEIKIDH